MNQANFYRGNQDYQKLLKKVKSDPQQVWFINEQRHLDSKKPPKTTKPKEQKSQLRKRCPKAEGRSLFSLAFLQQPRRPAGREAVVLSPPTASTTTICTTTSFPSVVLSPSLFPLAPQHQHCWNCIFGQKTWVLCHWVNSLIYCPPPLWPRLLFARTNWVLHYWFLFFTVAGLIPCRS